MAESTAFARRGHVAGARPSTIAAGLSDSATSFTGADLATWAGTTTDGPTYLEASYDTSTPEVMQAGSVSGNAVTSITRGLRGTTARAHDPNCKIRLVHTDRDFSEANKLVYELLSRATTAGQIPYVTASGVFAMLAAGTTGYFLKQGSGPAAPAWAQPTAVFYTWSTWTIGGEVKVPSGDTDFIIPTPVAEGANETVVLDKIRYKINSGTSVTFKMQQNGGDITGYTGLSCTTTAATTDAADVGVADLDLIVPVVTAVAATPKNMFVAALFKHTVTVS